MCQHLLFCKGSCFSSIGGNCAGLPSGAGARRESCLSPPPKTPRSHSIWATKVVEVPVAPSYLDLGVAAVKWQNRGQSGLRNTEQMAGSFLPGRTWNFPKHPDNESELSRITPLSKKPAWRWQVYNPSNCINCHRKPPLRWKQAIPVICLNPSSLWRICSFRGHCKG